MKLQELLLPDARTFGAVLGPIRYMPAPVLVDWVHVRAPAGFRLPAMVGGVRTTRTDGRGEPVRVRKGGAHHHLITAPRAAVLKVWGDDVGDDHGRELGALEVIERDGGFLIVGRSTNALASRHLAMVGGAFGDALPPQVRELIESENAADDRAWGHLDGRPTPPAPDGLDDLGRKHLATFTAEGFALRPPFLDLPPEAHRAIRKALEGAGGRWDRRAKAYLFPEPAAPIMVRLVMEA